MCRCFKKGQSILEYTLILGAIIGVVVLVLFVGQNSMKQRIDDTYDAAGQAVEDTTDDLTGGVFQEGPPEHET